MMVVSDTSAITALIQVGRIELLSQLYETVLIPKAVADELWRAHPQLPEFIKIQPVTNLSTVKRLLVELDEGEAEAIALMLEGRGDILLMDERKGRRIAGREGVRVIGLLGVLAEARRTGLVTSLAELLRHLEATAGFHISKDLKMRVLIEFGER
jgi:predicted nucleic acid-binding protein